jgi:hypothetical protein
VEKVRDIVGLYLDPPVGAMVLAVDEKSQMQALDRTAPVLPMMPAAPARQTHWDDSCSAPEPGSDPRSHRLRAQ